MLELLRRAVKSWAAKALLGLLVISFAVWGIGDIATGVSTTVATVGEEEVEADVYARVLRNEAQRYGLDTAQIRETSLDRFVLARMVREAALAAAANRLGLSAPDSAVARQARAEPAFQVGGEFDPAQYQSVVRRAFPSVADYEETVRRALAADQISSVATTGAAPVPAEVEAILRAREERRVMAALTLTADDLGEDAIPEPTEAELTEWLERHAARFEAPERRAVTWVEIDPVAMAGEIPETELLAAYEARRDAYATPERRVVDQIVYPTLAEAEAAMRRIEAGEATFDDLLAERGLDRADAALGEVTPGDLTGPRGEAAFALDAPGVAGPAEAAGGHALLNVRSIEPADVTPFEAVRDDIAEDIALERGRPEADRVAEEVADLRAGGATLEEVAAELRLPLKEEPSLQAQGDAAGLPAGQEFRDEAFAAEPGDERDLVRTPEGGWFALRVDEVKPPVTPPLEAIRDAVAADWRRARVTEALAERAQAIRDRVEAGERLEAVASELGEELGTVGPLRRDDPDPRLGEEARAALFAAEPGAAAVSTREGSATVLVLRETLAPEEGPAREAIAQALAQSLAADQLEYLGRALEAEAGVELHPRTIDAVLSQIGA